MYNAAEEGTIMSITMESGEERCGKQEDVVRLVGAG